MSNLDEILRLQTSSRTAGESLLTNSRTLQRVKEQQDTLKTKLTNTGADISSLREAFTTQVITIPTRKKLSLQNIIQYKMRDVKERITF